VIRVKTSLDHKRIRCLIWLVLTLFVLLGYSLQSAAGSAYYSMVTQNYATVSSPPVILQNGTAGSSTIYTNNTSAKVSVEAPLFDYVDNNDADVDSSVDRGMHSNFPAQQAGPDSTYDTLTEENTEAIEDYVDTISDVDNSSDVGAHSNFENQKDYDSTYDTLTEQNTGGEITKVGTDISGTGNNLTLSFSHTLVSGTARIVIVSIGVENGDTIDVSTVTYGGVTMTLAVEGIVSSTGFFFLCEIWYILESDLPSDGSQTVEITCSGTPYELEVNGFCSEYTGVTQGAPEATAEHNQTIGTTITNDISPSDNAWVISAVGAGNSDGSFTHGQGQVEVLDFQDYSSTFAVAELRGASGETSLDSTYSGTLNRLERVAASWTEATEDDNYELDLEIQFTAVIDFLPTETLCINTGTFSGTEDINVDFWNGTGWENLATDLTAYSCNYYTVSLTSTIFIIRFRGGNDTSDTIQDQWQIDASSLRVEGAGDKEDAVDNETSDEDSSSDLGVLTDFTNMTAYDANMANLTETTGGVDGDWGDTNNPGGTSSPQTTARAMGGISPDVDNMTLTSISVWWGGTGTGRLAVYQGGALDNPTGATLVWDAGQVAIPATAGWVTISGGSASLAKNTPTWLAWKCNDANYYYSTSWDSASDFQSGRGRVQLNDEGAASTDVWDAIIGAFNFDNYWYDIYINYTIPANYQLDQEVQWTDIPYLLPNENLSIYGGTMGAEDLEVDVWNGTGWETVFADLSSGWNNASITNWLTTSNFTIRFKGGTETSDTNEDTWQIDVALIHIWYDGGESYELNLEVQWTNTDYTRTNEELCIKTGTFSGSENIQVRVWNNTGNSWHWVMNLTANQWNNVSITSYLTSSTFTVQFLGGTETSDITQDNWNIDATLLHVWTSASTWRSGWDKRVKITIDHNGIDSDLSNFPVLVYLSNSSGLNNDDVTFVFDEVGSNRKKIAVTESDGTTQCYAEIEKWDVANQKAWLWIRAPSISSAIDTVLYLYYDKDHADNTNYVGDIGSSAAQNVWDSSFKGVWHLSETSGGVGAVKDSTSNNNAGTDNGSPTFNATGLTDSAISFDGSDDYIYMSNSASLNFTSSLTIEGWINLESFGYGSDVDIVLRKGEGNPNDYQLAIHDQKLALMIEENDDAGLESSANLTATTWYYLAGTWNGSIRRVYLNGSEDGSGSKTGNIDPDTRGIYIGGRSGTDLSTGIIDEVRASNTTRSAAWIKASYESGRDALLDFASEESEGTYDYVLRVNNSVADSWQIRLKKYSDSNINRLQNCIIYFHNSSDGTSNQIIIENGSYINQTGPWYDLGDSETVYIAMTVQANSAATSYVYAYLEIRTPNTTTYAQYVITFEIT